MINVFSYKIHIISITLNVFNLITILSGFLTLSYEYTQILKDTEVK
jgi:hypothetical protein